MGCKKYSSPRGRVEAFTGILSIRLPILLAPMAGACPPSLSIAVANVGGLGACGTLLMEPEAIKAWSAEFRRQSKGEFQINLWIPDPLPARDFQSEKQQREYLAAWGPPVPTEAGDAGLPDFEAQCQAMIAEAPKAISSIMGLYPLTLSRSSKHAESYGLPRLRRLLKPGQLKQPVPTPLLPRGWRPVDIAEPSTLIRENVRW